MGSTNIPSAGISPKVNTGGKEYEGNVKNNFYMLHFIIPAYSNNPSSFTTKKRKDCNTFTGGLYV